MDKSKILTEIKKLPEKDRILIAEIILDGLQTINPEIEKAWAEEARRRLKNFQEDKTKAITGEQVEREIIEVLGGKDPNPE